MFILKTNMSMYTTFFKLIVVSLSVDLTKCVYLYQSPNVKTALFNELDVLRACWSQEQIILLRARMIMQDLVPKKVPRDIPYLVEYLRSAEEAVVKHSPDTKVRRIMMMALSDVLGGYLQAVAIPMTKEAYYAGNIDYATMSRLYEMLGEMRHRLRTNGGRWSRPVDMSKFSVRVTALNLPMENSELACKAIFVTPAEECAPGLSRIAIPYLDYDRRPGAVALPLKSRNLFSLKTAASSHIIVRFYILARQCLSEMPPKDTLVFNALFIRWLTTKVVPKLYEDNWYPGFGSVMRIVETVNETQMSHPMEPYFAANDSSLERFLVEGKSCGVVGTVANLAKFHVWFFMVVVTALLVLLCMLLCCCCWSARGYRSGGFLANKSSSSLLNAVMSVYCGMKDKANDKERLDAGEGRRGWHRAESDASSTVPDTTSSDDDYQSSVSSRVKRQANRFDRSDT